jgi:hypothetical protein
MTNMNHSVPLLSKLRTQVKKSAFVGTVLALDPGETTGWSIMDVGHASEIILADQGQIKTWPMEEGLPRLTELVDAYKPEFIVYEAYHVYAWRLNEHTFSEVPTIQLIGMIKTVALQRSINFGEQTAQTGKAFFTDQRLKTLGIFFEGQKHARDSLRHACQFVTFGLKDKTNA